MKISLKNYLVSFLVNTLASGKQFKLLLRGCFQFSNVLEVVHLNFQLHQLSYTNYTFTFSEILC